MDIFPSVFCFKLGITDSAVSVETVLKIIIS
nr:MAG TPA: hypothetical protein [Caudoviricetes sp.]